MIYKKYEDSFFKLCSSIHGALGPMRVLNIMIMIIIKIIIKIKIKIKIMIMIMIMIIYSQCSSGNQFPIQVTYCNLNSREPLEVSCCS